MQDHLCAANFSHTLPRSTHVNAFALLLWVSIAGMVILSACSHTGEPSLKVLLKKAGDVSLWAKLHWDELLESFKRAE